MNQSAAPMSFSIRFVTTFVLLLAGAAVIGAAFRPELWIAASLLMLVCILCYLSAPVSYSLDGDRLVVHSHIRNKAFGPVVRCSQIDPPRRFGMWIGLRLLGNGGLFAGTGIFWNRMFGLFRAYVTSARYSDLVLVETTGRKIVISPENPQLFAQSWEWSTRKSDPQSS